MEAFSVANAKLGALKLGKANNCEDLSLQFSALEKAYLRTFDILGKVEKIASVWILVTFAAPWGAWWVIRHGVHRNNKNRILKSIRVHHSTLAYF